jgi:O-antigen/teichoic acid export membrane protein
MQKTLSFYTFYYLTSLLLMRGGGILAKILLARSITPYEYGLITLFVIVLPGILQILTTFCFYDILGHATEGKKYLGFSLQYGIIATAIVTIIFLIFQTSIFTFLNIPLDYWGILTIILFVVLFSVTVMGIIIGYLRGIRDYSMAATVSAAPNILRVFFIFFAVYLFNIRDFSLVIIIFTIPFLVTLIPLVVFKFRDIHESIKTITIPSWDMFAFGLAFFLLNIWVGLSQQINSIIISHDLGVVWQGYFDVSLSVVTIITFFSSAMYLVSAPETTLKTKSDHLYQKGGLGDVGRLLFSLSLLCVIVIYFYSHQMITLLFTSNYVNAADYLYILAIGYAILFIQQYVGYLNISSAKNGINRLILITVAGILVYPLFTHIMISFFQFLGVYIASTVFIVIYTLITIALVSDRTPLWHLLKKIDRLLISILATGLIIYFLQLSLIPGMVTTGVVFLLFIILSGYIDKDLILDILRIKK